MRESRPSAWPLQVWLPSGSQTQESHPLVLLPNLPSQSHQAPSFTAEGQMILPLVAARPVPPSLKTSEAGLVIRTENPREAFVGLSEPEVFIILLNGFSWGGGRGGGPGGAKEQ